MGFLENRQKLEDNLMKAEVAMDENNTQLLQFLLHKHPRVDYDSVSHVQEGKINKDSIIVEFCQSFISRNVGGVYRRRYKKFIFDKIELENFIKQQQKKIKTL